MEAIYYIRNGKATTHLDKYPVVKNIEDVAKVLMLDGALKIDMEFAKHIFRWLDVWEVAAPFYDYNKMLVDIADEHDKAKIIKVVFDLRIPLYRNDIVFIRTNENTKKLLNVYEKQKAEYHNHMVAFMHAIWVVKPYIIYLPKEILE